MIWPSKMWLKVNSNWVFTNRMWGVLNIFNHSKVHVEKGWYLNGYGRGSLPRRMMFGWCYNAFLHPWILSQNTTRNLSFLSQKWSKMNINPRILVVKWSEFLLNKHGSSMAPAACVANPEWSDSLLISLVEWGKSTGKSTGFNHRFNQPDLASQIFP